MRTQSAERSLAIDTSRPDATEVAAEVAHPAALISAGWTPSAIAGQINARRWQRCGRAIVLHNGPLSAPMRWQTVLINLGPRAVLTSFTAAEAYGLRGWTRPEVHVLVPRGARVRPSDGISMRIHYTADWDSVRRHPARPLQSVPDSLVLAAAAFDSPRPACGILAAAVQQKLVSAEQQVDAVERATRVRHRRHLRAAMQDIAQGCDALSEIDLARLCRRFKLPEPVRQAVRVERSGRRRYLDASWELADGRTLAVEVDDALHLKPQRWCNDQLRQNELTLQGTLILRFPSILVRTEAALVADQIRRALQL